MRLIGGNGRVEVMKRLGWKEADANVIDCTDAEARALSVRLNRTADLADWSPEGLAAAYEELKDSDYAFDTLGFDAEELAAWNAPEPAPTPTPSTPAASPQNAKPAGEYENKYAILIPCKDEAEQMLFFERFRSEGYTVKVLAL